MRPIAKPRNKPSMPRFRWKIVGIMAGIVVVAFAIGYTVAVLILFPPIDEPENGIVVPSVLGSDVPTAEAQLSTMGLRVVEVIEIAHPSQPPGIIVAQSPLPGQQLRTAGAVTVGISAGPPRVAVPNVTGMRVENALAELQRLGFEANQQTEAAPEPAGTVIGVSPRAGTELVPPQTLLLTVSSGPAPVVPDSAMPADTTGVSPVAPSPRRP
jgi:serine/threonine-protein kinase